MSCRVRAFLRSRSPTVTMQVSVANLVCQAILLAHTTDKARQRTPFLLSTRIRSSPTRPQSTAWAVFSEAQLSVDWAASHQEVTVMWATMPDDSWGMQK